MSEVQKCPLVTFALLAYNQEKFIREAVLAALSQEYMNLEIIFSDDSSTDSTFDIITSIVSNYSGPHEIIINRNPVNCGLTKHFSEILGRARGEIIVIAAGDDVSLPMRVANTVELFRSDPGATLVSFSDTVIDESGNELAGTMGQESHEIRTVNLEDYMAGRSIHPSGASRGLRKKVFEVFGGLNDACPTEDTPSLLRCLMSGHALVSPERGILYRQHGTNLSGQNSLHSMNFEEIKNQYVRDADLAYSIGLINEDLMAKIKKFSEKNYRRRKLSGAFYKSQNKSKFFLSNMVLSMDFSFREKARMIYSILR